MTRLIETNTESALAANDVVSVEDARWARGLKRAREALGLTQNQLAELAGIPNRTTVCELERGDRKFTRSTLLRLGSAFGLSSTVDAIGWLERWAVEADDDSDLIDEDPLAFTEAQYEEAMRDLADGELAWKGLAVCRRHQLEVALEMLVAGDVDGARDHLMSVLAEGEEVRRG